MCWGGGPQSLHGTVPSESDENIVVPSRTLHGSRPVRCGAGFTLHPHRGNTAQPARAVLPRSDGSDLPVRRRYLRASNSGETVAW